MFGVLMASNNIILSMHTVNVFYCVGVYLDDLTSPTHKRARLSTPEAFSTPNTSSMSGNTSSIAGSTTSPIHYVDTSFSDGMNVISMYPIDPFVVFQVLHEIICDPAEIRPLFHSYVYEMPCLLSCSRRRLPGGGGPNCRRTVANGSTPQLLVVYCRSAVCC